jgi:DNA primase
MIGGSVRWSPVGAGGGRAGADEWVERVRAATDIVELVGQTVPLRRVGRNHVGRCPFHDEKSPSFSVNADRQFYHCFGCKAGGDAFKFVMETEKVGFLEAVELLSRRAGIPVPERRARDGQKRAPLLEAIDAAASQYEQWLADPQVGGEARAYLEKRGITRETQREFRLGLSLPGWENLVPRLRGRFHEDVLLEARLAGRREGGRGAYDWFRNRLMVPLIEPGGAVVGFGARAMGDEQPKYLNSPESAVYHKSRFLYGLEHARRALKADGELVVVEGYFDVIALHQAGVRNVVAASGTALTPEHAQRIRQMVRGVALTFDGDAAGQNAMLRSLGVLLAAGLDVAVVDLPAGDDPDTLVRRAGADGWCRVRDSAYDAVEFVHRHVLRTATGGDPRERALQVVVRMLTGVQDTIRLQLLVERSSQVFGIPERVIEQAVRRARVPDSARASSPVVPVPSRPVHELDRALLRALWAAPEAIADVRELVAPTDLVEGAARDLAERWWRDGVSIPSEEGEAGARPRGLAAEQQGEGWDPQAELVGAVRRLQVRRLQDEMRTIRARLPSASPEESEALLQQVHDIGQKLKQLSQ